MAASPDTLLRTGAISMRAYNKTLAATRPGVPTKMADFDGRQGRRDQGGVRDTGHEVGKSDHVNRHQRVAGGGGVTPAPSKGGRVNASRVPKRMHIDGFPAKQAKTFPAGAGYSERPDPKAGPPIARNTRMKGARNVSSGGPPSSKDYYGGPGNRGSM